MKKVIIISLSLVVLAGLFIVGKSFLFKSKRHRNTSEQIKPTNDTSQSAIEFSDTVGAAKKNIASSVSTTESSAVLTGKWVRIKEVDTDGSVLLDKDCNVINYKVELSENNTFTMEFDRTDNPSNGAHKTKTGTWKTQKSSDLVYPSYLVLEINKATGGTNEKVHKVKFLNSTSLILIDPENKTQYFKKTK